MFRWTRPAGLKVFRNTPEKAELTRVLAANQGLYNGFLAAGLAWAVLSSQRDVALFFLGCVVVAGLYGTATVGRRIFYVQAVPALAAIAAVLVAGLPRSEEHTSELQSLMRISYAVFCLKKKKKKRTMQKIGQTYM